MLQACGYSGSQEIGGNQLGRADQLSEISRSAVGARVLILHMIQHIRSPGLSRQPFYAFEDVIEHTQVHEMKSGLCFVTQPKLLP